MRVIENENTVFFDVDFTLIYHKRWVDGNSYIKPKPKEYERVLYDKRIDMTLVYVPSNQHITLLKQCFTRGRTVFVWSNNGYEWAKMVIKQLQLEEFVHYVINRDLGLDAVPRINSKSSKWRAVDYLNSYSDLKREVYVSLKSFLDKYPKISIPVAAHMFDSGTPNDHGSKDAFEEGRLTDDHKDKTLEVALILKDFEPHMDGPYSRRMFQAIMLLQDSGKYDHDLMMQKFQETGKRIEALESAKTIIQEMENIINHKSRKRILIH